MWSKTPILLTLTALLATPASSAMVKTGSTCVVTPLSSTPAAIAHRSIGAVPPSERDLSPDDSPDGDSTLWAARDTHLGRYPRAEPGSGKASPLVARRVDEEEEERERVAGPLPRQNRVDDTPQILSAFSQCGKDGVIILREGTYYIRQVMDTTNLSNVSIEIYGTLVWSSDNLSYWRQKSFSVTYAGRQTAWRIGGKDIAMRGFGKALFDGNGQAWIDLARGQGNLDGRPISLTVWQGTNVFIDGITW